METLITQINIYPKGENPFFNEGVTTIRLDDEAAGMFIIMGQCININQELRLDIEEIDAVCEVLQHFKKLVSDINDIPNESDIGECDDTDEKHGWKMKNVDDLV